MTARELQYNMNSEPQQRHGIPHIYKVLTLSKVRVKVASKPRLSSTHSVIHISSVFRNEKTVMLNLPFTVVINQSV
jgi:hypothetical protein